MTIEKVREQIQEDIITYFSSLQLGMEGAVDDLCQIVVDRINELEDYPNGAITQGDKKLKEMLKKDLTLGN